MESNSLDTQQLISSTTQSAESRERERERRREGGKSLLAYVKGVDPYLIHIDRPTTIRSPEGSSSSQEVAVYGNAARDA